MFVFSSQDPGPWPYFIQRHDNIGLPIQIVTDKYLTEQLKFQNEYSEFLSYQNWLSSQPKGPALSQSLNPNTGDEVWNITTTLWEESIGTWDM